MKKYKGGFYSDSLFFQILEVFAYVIILIEVIEMFMILPYNIVQNSGVNCTTEDWISFGIVNKYIEKPCEKTSGDNSLNAQGKCNNLGKWKQYDKNDNDFLCAPEADQIFMDAVNDNIVSGYTSTELLAYIIVPTLTVLGIIYGIIFTRLNVAEWIFWILIATLIYTGLSTVATRSDIDILPPDQPSPLTYITDKLDLQTSDELQYSFMSRKSDGSSCLVEGVWLGGGTHSSSGAPTYTGDCTAETLPLE